MKKTTEELRIERVNEITAKLEQGVKDVFTSERYINYLTTMSKFHRYSYRNCLLIAMQCPNASHVASYTGWQKNFNRQVRHGEKAIKILAPRPYTVTKNVILADGSTEEQEVEITKFSVANVFDFSQTDGEPLPTICEKLTGKVDGYKELIEKLTDISPVPVEYEDIDGANGYFNFVEHRIALDRKLSEVHTLKTLIHELSHAILHNKEDGAEMDADRETKEVQAESVAYVVSQYLGIDTSEYSFGYVASWSSGKDTQELTASLEIIKNTAETIIKGIEA